MSPVKVVHLISGLNLGGAEMMLYKLVSRVNLDRCQPVVISLIPTGVMGARIAALGVPVHSLGMRPGTVSLRGMSALLRLLQEERPQVLQTWMYHADLLGLICGGLRHVPRIVWNVRCSTMLANSSRLTAWTVRACSFASRWPAAVIFNSESGRAYHASLGYAPRQSLVIPNGFDIDHFAPNPRARAEVRATLKLADDVPVIGLFGRYHPQKDHASFLRAAALVRRQRPDVQFLLVGTNVDADNQELGAVRAELDLGDSIHLLGERSDVNRLMAAVDIVASSAAFGEGFPNVIGEAMACGLPCAVTDVGDSGPIVENTGLVVRPSDPAALAEACNQLIALGREGRAALGRAARERVERNYSLQAIAATYENVYLSLSRN